MVRVLVIEDSPTVQELLVEILSEDPEIEVVGRTNNGLKGVELAHELRPDVITMDIHMPQMDGFQATKRIMIEVPTPIVIISASANLSDTLVSMQAIKMGAMEVLEKPVAVSSPDFDDISRSLVKTVKAISQVKPVRHWRERKDTATIQAPPRSARKTPAATVRVIAIGASTGGPGALSEILSQLPHDFPLPILIVQHIGKGFTQGFANWLETMTSLRIKIAEDGEPLRPATVYLAPEGNHLQVNRRLRAELSRDAPVKGFRPSATRLFSSVADRIGAEGLGIILTGMGEDGVDGLQALQGAGGFVIAQDEASSVVYGMPAAAVAADCVDKSLPPKRIGEWLVKHIGKEGGKT